ncbi:hypothetical protein AMTRI_Chr05g64940 [Amborella trichopoda]
MFHSALTQIISDENGKKKPKYRSTAIPSQDYPRTQNFCLLATTFKIVIKMRESEIETAAPHYIIKILIWHLCNYKCTGTHYKSKVKQACSIKVLGGGDVLGKPLNRNQNNQQIFLQIHTNIN